MTFFGLKEGHDLENRAGHPHKEFRGVLSGTVSDLSAVNCLKCEEATGRKVSRERCPADLNDALKIISANLN